MPCRYMLSAGLAAVFVALPTDVHLSVSPLTLRASAYAYDGPTDAEIVSLFRGYARSQAEGMIALQSWAGPPMACRQNNLGLGPRASNADVDRCMATQKRKDLAAIDAGLAQLVVTVKTRTNLEGNYLVVVNARRNGDYDSVNYKMLLHNTNSHWVTLKAEEVGE
jgi:hypothetical protein